MESIKAKASGQYFGHKLNVARTRKTEEHTQWRFKAKAIADKKTEEQQIGGRFPRVFGEEFCDKFSDEFSESPNLVMN